jgi:hypothetical protein
MTIPAASLPPPTPLRQALRGAFQWGEQKHEFVATAASIRIVFWEKLDRDVTWLHCKAIQTMAMNPDGPNDLMTVLIPVEYITRAEPGPDFRLLRWQPRTDLGIFPPNQPPPANAVPLAELERVLAQLRDVTLN